MVARIYNTPNSWWYFDIDINTKYGWCSIYMFTKSFSVYWGKNAHLIPKY